MTRCHTTLTTVTSAQARVGSRHTRVPQGLLSAGTGETPPLPFRSSLTEDSSTQGSPLTRNKAQGKNPVSPVTEEAPAFDRTLRFRPHACSADTTRVRERAECSVATGPQFGNNRRSTLLFLTFSRLFSCLEAGLILHKHLQLLQLAVLTIPTREEEAGSAGPA